MNFVARIQKLSRRLLSLFLTNKQTNLGINLKFITLSCMSFVLPCSSFCYTFKVLVSKALNNNKQTKPPSLAQQQQQHQEKKSKFVQEEKLFTLAQLTV